MRLVPSLALATPFLVLLGSCVGPAPRPPATPSATPQARPAGATPAPIQSATPAPVATEWYYRSVATGNWSYLADPAGSFARFGPTAADARLTVRCDRATRRVSISRVGAGQGAMTLRTSYGAVSWPATATAGQTVAVRAAADPALDQIGYSRGKFAVDVAGLELLVVPAWPEVSRVIEDCRG